MWILPNLSITGWREREERHGAQEEEENKNPLAKKQNKNNRKKNHKISLDALMQHTLKPVSEQFTYDILIDMNDKILQDLLWMAATTLKAQST